MPFRLVPTRSAFVALAFSLACSDPICGCSPVDPQASVIVTGIVLDMAAAAVSGAEISLVGDFQTDCARDGYWRFAIPDPAVSDGAGRFELRITALALPGTHCVDLAARDPGTGLADTLYATPAQFREASPLDTVEVQFAIPR